MFRLRSIIYCALITLPLAGMLPMTAYAQGDNDIDLTSLSLESLLSMKVSSVSRHDEELRNTAAAVYVITQEDIRRSGLTDVAELLRMVPGMAVAQLTSNTWAVSTRGFNAQYATKLLVLVDGRTVYEPQFSGVYWQVLNLVLEDIEKIEVIRGPGATMWGANAVNGVISITTKSAENTLGGLFVADAGSKRPAEGSFRYGASIGNKAAFRIFGRQTTRSRFETTSGTPGHDSWNMTSSGFRLDWSPGTSDTLEFETSLYRGVLGGRQDKLASISPPTFVESDLEKNSGGFVSAHWNHSFNDSSKLIFQFNYDQRRADTYYSFHSSILDFDLQHSFKIGNRNQIVWGFDYRENRDKGRNSLDFGFLPANRKTNLASAFLQDEISIVPDKLSLTVGSKFERSGFSGFDVQPSVKLSWRPTARHSGWLSASRAVRTPSRIERDSYIAVGSFPAGPVSGIVELLGQDSARSEGLLAYEAGYRYQANRRFWLDLSTFYNVYDHLATAEPGAPFFEFEPQPPHIVAPVYFGNDMKGETYGSELAANYKATSFLTVRSSYSFLRMALHGNNGQTVASEAAENESPRHQLYVGSFLNLPKSFEVSGHSYFVGALPNFNIPSHTRLDLNVAWRGLENIELGVSGQNLLGSREEFGATQGPANKINPSVIGKITWRF
jgi:iron complex outermembrane recepter protein